MNVSFINCCAVPLHYIAHSFCPATLNGVLGSCLQKSKFYRGVPEPPGTPLPTPLGKYSFHVSELFQKVVTVNAK